MAVSLSQPNSVNVLMSNSAWPWPQAVEQIFQPRGINALMAENTDDIMRIIDNSKVHLAIIDNCIDNEGGIKTLDIIRKKDSLMPCLLLAGDVNNKLLAEALKLNVSSVLAKPIDLSQLALQMDRIFRKYYSCDVFSHAEEMLRKFINEHKDELPENGKFRARFTIRVKRK